MSWKRIYYLTVAGIHAYYVLAGNTPVLVHNCGTGAKDGSGLSDDDLLSATEALRDDYAASAFGSNKKSRPAVVTAGYNVETRQFAAGRSHGDGTCAEVCVLNQLGGDPSKIRLVSAVRPRTGNQHPICVTCEAYFGRESFVSRGVQFATDILRLFD